MKRDLNCAVKVLGKILAAALPIILVAGCKKDDDVRSSQVPKELKEAAAEPEADATAAGTGDLGFPGDLRWKLPADWKQVPPPAGRMGIRAAAAIQVSPEDPKLLLTMSQLPPDREIIQANIDRWSGMVHLTAPTGDDLKKVMTQRNNGDVTIAVIDLNNPAEPALRLLGAIVISASADRGQIWAMKVTGPAAKITAQKGRFDEFLGSIRFAASGAAPTGAETPPAAPEIATGADGVTWTLPAGWTAEPGSATNMRVATIHPGGNGATEIKVSKFGTIGGGLGANVTRWRREVGLGAVSDEEADAGQKVPFGPTTFTVHDYTGPVNGGTREVVVLTELNGATWYFKLIGPTDAVNAQKPAFDQFLSSLRFAQ